MELRSSRSRSKTPFTLLEVTALEEEAQEVKQTSTRTTRRTTVKVNEQAISSSEVTKLSAGKKRQKLLKTSDYSSEDGDSEVSSTKTISQNERNQLIEDARSASSNGTTDVSALDLYIKSGRYWERYPKTDWTYSQHSKDRIELAPGVVAMPNMSRKTIHSLDTSLSFLESHKLHKTTNTDSTLYNRTSDSKIQPKKLFNNNYENNFSKHKTKRSLFFKTLWSIWILTSTVFHKAFLLQTYVFSKIHRFVSRLMLLDTWLLRKTGPRNDKLLNIVVLCLLPLLILGGWWILSHLSSFLYSGLYSTKPASKLDLKLDEEVAAKLQLFLNDNQQKIEDLEGEITRIKSQVFRYQAFNAHTTAKLTHQIKRCCNKPVINVEGYISKLFNDGTFLNNQKGFNDWLKAMFVAKSDLESRLENLTQNFDVSKTQSVNSQLIMDEITSRISKLTTEPHYNRNPKELASIPEQTIKSIVLEVLKIYDADKTGLVDYALESMGGQILTTRCTETYHYGKAVVSILGLPLWYPTNSPRTVLTPDLSPGKCWAFQNFPGFLVVKLSNRVKIDAVSVEHVSRLLVPEGKIDSAPKDFELYGLEAENDKNPVLLGHFSYDYNGEPLQFFNIKEPKSFELVELRVLSNHGNPNYTCLYRIRVHGQPEN